MLMLFHVAQMLFFFRVFNVTFDNILFSSYAISVIVHVLNRVFMVFLLQIMFIWIEMLKDVKMKVRFDCCFFGVFFSMCHLSVHRSKRQLVCLFTLFSC